MAFIDIYSEARLDHIHNLHRQNQKLGAARGPLLPRLLSGEMTV